MCGEGRESINGSGGMSIWDFYDYTLYDFVYLSCIGAEYRRKEGIESDRPCECVFDGSGDIYASVRAAWRCAGMGGVWRGMGSDDIGGGADVCERGEILAGGGVL